LQAVFRRQHRNCLSGGIPQDNERMNPNKIWQGVALNKDDVAE